MTHRLKADVYESLIDSGFRRNGYYFYQNICPGCCACIPLRVDIRRFRPSRSQKRVVKKNRDIRVTRLPAVFDTDGFHLYRKYCLQRHHTVETADNYMRFLIDSPVPTQIMRYYLGNALVGMGWIDVLTHSLSSVYFAFDPDFDSRSLGVFSVLKEISLCRELGKRWLQMGFWVRENRKMAYKKNYKPCQLLINERWVDADSTICPVFQDKHSQTRTGTDTPQTP